MKRLIRILAATLGLGAAVPAIAADLPVKAQGAAAPSYDPWSGFYLGVNGGYGWNLSGVQAFAPANLGTLEASPQGFVGGIHAGIGQRFSSILYAGLEGDIDVATLDGTASMLGLVSATSKNTWMGSIRARFGIIPVSHALIYGTAGYGFGSGQFSVTDLTTGASASISPTMSGFTWGGGLEVDLGARWMGRIEYLQYDFGNMNTTLEGVGFSTKDRVDVVRAGLSYRF